MKFKCKATNLIYSFEYEVDIASMMKHPDYEVMPDNESVEEATEEAAKPVKASKKTPKVTPDESNLDG